MDPGGQRRLETLEDPVGSPFSIALLVGGLVAICYFPIYWESSSQLTNISETPISRFTEEAGLQTVSLKQGYRRFTRNRHSNPPPTPLPL